MPRGQSDFLEICLGSDEREFHGSHNRSQNYRRELLDAEDIFETDFSPMKSEQQLFFLRDAFAINDQLKYTGRDPNRFWPFHQYIPPLSTEVIGQMTKERIAAERRALLAKRDPQGLWARAQRVAPLLKNDESQRRVKVVESVLRAVTPHPDPMWRTIMALQTGLSLGQIEEIILASTGIRPLSIVEFGNRVSLPKVSADAVETVVWGKGHVLLLYRNIEKGLHISEPSWTKLWTDDYFAEQFSKQLGR